MEEELNKLYEQAKEYIEKFPHDGYGLTEPDTRLQLEVLNQKADLIIWILQVLVSSQKAKDLQRQRYDKDVMQGFEKYYKHLIRSLEQYEKRRNNE